MRKLCYTMVCLLTALLLTGCKKGMNAEELNEKCATGVVLIVNYYYYSVTLPNGQHIYFTGVDREGDLEGFTFNEEEAIANQSGCTGTGFFISADGQLMTNRHVASPTIDPDAVKSFLKGFKRLMKKYYREEMQQLQAQYYQLEGQPGLQNRIAKSYEQYGMALETIDDMDMNDANIKTHTTLSIVYDDSFVNKPEDLHPCNTVAVSNIEAVDLAIIQLKDQQTPQNAYVFPLAEDDDLTMDQKLFMIGYNWGLTISKTAQGIRSQCYSGNVTQKSDGEKVLYSIPSLQGSSGSPVINEYGELVAVNFAGYAATQSFNYGIPLKKVRQFLRDN